MKKLLIALVGVLALALAAPTPAFAADPAPKADKATKKGKKDKQEKSCTKGADPTKDPNACQPD